MSYLNSRPINTPSQHHLSSHLINTHTLNTPNPPYQPTISTDLLNPPIHCTLSTHPIHPFYPFTERGLAGNEDAGQMSAWLVLSSIGFYQVCPGCGGANEYILGMPQFSHIEISLPKTDPRYYTPCHYCTSYHYCTPSHSLETSHSPR